MNRRELMKAFAGLPLLSEGQKEQIASKEQPTEVKPGQIWYYGSVPRLSHHFFLEGVFDSPSHLLVLPHSRVSFGRGSDPSLNTKGLNPKLDWWECSLFYWTDFAPITSIGTMYMLPILDGAVCVGYIDFDSVLVKKFSFDNLIIDGKAREERRLKYNIRSQQVK